MRAVGCIPIIPMISHTVGRKTTLINSIEPLASARRFAARILGAAKAAKVATIGRFINSNVHGKKGSRLKTWNSKRDNSWWFSSKSCPDPTLGFDLEPIRSMTVEYPEGQTSKHDAERLQIYKNRTWQTAPYPDQMRLSVCQ